jgi:hypothetical protein
MSSVTTRRMSSLSAKVVESEEVKPGIVVDFRANVAAVLAEQGCKEYGAAAASRVIHVPSPT